MRVRKDLQLPAVPPTKIREVRPDNLKELLAKYNNIQITNITGRVLSTVKKWRKSLQIKNPYSERKLEFKWPEGIFWKPLEDPSIVGGRTKIKVQCLKCSDIHLVLLCNILKGFSTRCVKCKKRGNRKSPPPTLASWPQEELLLWKPKSEPFKVDKKWMITVECVCGTTKDVVYRYILNKRSLGCIKCRNKK